MIRPMRTRLMPPLFLSAVRAVREGSDVLLLLEHELLQLPVSTVALAAAHGDVHAGHGRRRRGRGQRRRRPRGGGRAGRRGGLHSHGAGGCGAGRGELVVTEGGAGCEFKAVVRQRAIMQRRFTERRINANVVQYVVIGQSHGNCVQRHHFVCCFQHWRWREMHMRVLHSLSFVPYFNLT